MKVKASAVTPGAVKAPLMLDAVGSTTYAAGCAPARSKGE
jgi:hypothetical protein